MDIHDVQRLERVAEELMGRRKWKLYQEVLARSQLNANTNTAQNETADQNNRLGLSQQSDKEKLILQPPALVENHSKESEVVTIKSEINENPDDKGCPTADTGNTGERLSESTVDNLESSITKTEEPREPPPPSYPVDWKPTDRCYFCVDGKLLTVNEKGDLVAESGPASSEAELARASLDSDSDSSDSSPEIEVQNQNATNANKTVTSLLRDSLPPNMTSFESMAAHLAAVASLRGLQSGLAPFYPSLWYHQLAQVPSAANTTTSEASVAAISPTIKESTSPSDVTGEQPLDLSAKPSPNSSMTGSMDPKQVFRAKPRVSAVPGRRTYTEEELHSALQDIISGKLGTRRAAVLYGIPRSTLRNKVYKIAMEHRREASALHQGELVDPEDEDRDGSGDDEKDDSLLSSSLGGAQVDDLSSFATSHLAAAALQKISKASSEGGNQLDIKPSITHETQPKVSATTPQPQTPPITPNPWFDPNVLLQSLLLTGSLGGIPGLVGGGPAKQDDPAAIQEAFKSFMLHQELIKEQLKGSAVASDLLNNGKPNITDPRILMQNLPLLQQQQQQQHHHQQQQSQVHQQSLHHHYQNRVRNSETPETASSTDMNEASDDPSIILKIPSYKPVAGSSTSSAGKNGEGLSSPIPQTTPPIISRSPHQQNNLQGISPPLIRQSSESQSPPMATNKGLLSLRDVIANSISRTFNQQANKDSCNTKPPPALEPIDPYKRANISVIKNLGGTDISRFATTPNLLGHNSSNSQNSSVAGGLGGKGTRPKRGKYRNYDRDSLVEAVKAVQRGEMSVHRAGSYYGVPHSTLEYKVKERHLMRPRKREPKPQPLDDRTAGGSSNSMNSKNTNIPGLTSVGGLDKSKVGLGQKPPGKNQPFSSTSPNGMKVPIFDPAMAAQLQYSPHLFWPHSSGFSGLPIDFGRPPPGAPGAAPSFPPNAAESLLASQMMQRFHEGSANMRHSASSSGTNSSNSGGAGVLNAANSVTAGNLPNSKPTANNSSGAATKTARELAESLYDGASANGSFLDGIIRQTLDRKTGEISHGALLDQLVKNTRGPATMVCNDDQGRPTNSKRPGSPLHFSPMEIKKERASPISSGVASAHGDLVDASSIERDISKESVESLLKLRDGLTLKVEDKQQQSQQQQPVHSQHHHHSHHALHQQPQVVTSNLRHLSIEDLNGRGSVGIHDSLGQIKSETEDSL